MAAHGKDLPPVRGQRSRVERKHVGSRVASRRRACERVDVIPQELAQRPPLGEGFRCRFRLHDLRHTFASSRSRRFSAAVGADRRSRCDGELARGKARKEDFVTSGRRLCRFRWLPDVQAALPLLRPGAAVRVRDGPLSRGGRHGRRSLRLPLTSPSGWCPRSAAGDCRRLSFGRSRASDTSACRRGSGSRGLHLPELRPA